MTFLVLSKGRLITACSLAAVFLLQRAATAKKGVGKNRERVCPAQEQLRAVEITRLNCLLKERERNRLNRTNHTVSRRNEGSGVQENF